MNIKTLLAAGAIALISTSALAGIKPPARFDHEPKIPYKIYYMGAAELRKACFAKWYHIGLLAGCTKVLVGPDRCAIFILKYDVPNTGWPISDIAPIITKKMMIQHEKAHCNGWSARHER